MIQTRKPAGSFRVCIDIHSKLAASHLIFSIVFFHKTDKKRKNIPETEVDDSGNRSFDFNSIHKPHKK